MILVVDDDADVLKLVNLILTSRGYDVVTASGAENAISKTSKLSRSPDLLLTDVVMPGLSGPMLADRLTESHPEMRVLFMSGYDDRQVVRRYVTEKGFALLPKPFTADQLSSKVDAVLKTERRPSSPPTT